MKSQEKSPEQIDRYSLPKKKPLQDSHIDSVWETPTRLEPKALGSPPELGWLLEDCQETNIPTADYQPLAGFSNGSARATCSRDTPVLSFRVKTEPGMQVSQPLATVLEGSGAPKRRSITPEVAEEKMLLAAPPEEPLGLLGNSDNR